MVQRVRKNNSLCGLCVIDVFLLSYPSPLLPFAEPKGDFHYTLYSRTSKGKTGELLPFKPFYAITNRENQGKTPAGRLKMWYNCSRT